MVKDNERPVGAAENTDAENTVAETSSDERNGAVTADAAAESAEQVDGRDAAGAEPESAPADPFAGVAMSTTTLIFHAPAIAPLPALPRDDRPDFDDEDEDEDERGSSMRRRSRRRRGEDGGRGSGEQSTPSRGRAQREPELITEPQRIKGSTRLEAKKQRRRDGRDAGRRRAVVTEAEFLARRESVDRAMVVRSKEGRIQIGVLEDGVLVEHYVARNQEASLIGNVYLGRVQNVLPSMEAAFVDIGRGRNAVLYSGEVDWDAAAARTSPAASSSPSSRATRSSSRSRRTRSATRAPVSPARSRCPAATSCTCRMAP
jgi:ribonuclease E